MISGLSALEAAAEQVVWGSKAEEAKILGEGPLAGLTNAALGLLAPATDGVVNFEGIVQVCLEGNRPGGWPYCANEDWPTTSFHNRSPATLQAATIDEQKSIATLDQVSSRSALLHHARPGMGEE